MFKKKATHFFVASTATHSCNWVFSQQTVESVSMIDSQTRVTRSHRDPDKLHPDNTMWNRPERSLPSERYSRQAMSRPRLARYDIFLLLAFLHPPFSSPSVIRSASSPPFFAFS
jgi:hypothetical protein